MHFRMFAIIGLAGLLFASPASAASAGGCQEKGGKASCDMPCCKDHHSAAPEANAVDVSIAMDQPAAEPVAPARQAVYAWFQRPVRVGPHILQGRYVIEHDNDRMARGEPCTHIYAYNNQKLPLVAFHCIHLERDAAKEHKVVLASTGENTQQFVEFQFAGETGAHGLPTVR